jgi:PKD repeat protein
MKKVFPLIYIFLHSLAGFSQVNLSQGLMAYYPFDGNANDASGNNNNPVFNNARLTADRFGNPNSAYHFNGVNNYMRVRNNPSLNMANKISISLWVKPTGYYTGLCYNNMMVMKGDIDYLEGNYSVRFSDAYTGCTDPTTTKEMFYGAPGIAAPAPIVQLNQWYHVVFTCDGNMTRIYVDCVLRANSPQGNAKFTNPYDLFIGHMNTSQYPYWLNGDLDDIRIYNRALSKDEVMELCKKDPAPVNTKAQSCNNWLSSLTLSSYVTIGDVDVKGDQLTVEANFIRTVDLKKYQYSGGNLVSKHTNAADVNYALSPSWCEITTTNGYKNLSVTCAPKLNSTYHVAMVYNGSVLKFFINGFLIDQVAWTGNLVTNDLNTTIGQIAGNYYPYTNQFLGYINEVRIWKVARTQSQIRSYMNKSLPDPGSQVGLVAYYTFDNLKNKKNNNSYNGSLHGGASINATNPNCSFIADSCDVKKEIKPEPSADFTFSITNCNKVQFRTRNMEHIKTFKWDLGDKNSAVKESFIHVYQKEGNYTARLIATGTNGNEIIITKTFAITKQTAAFSYQRTGDDNSFTFTIDNKQKVKYKWLFGDGDITDKEKKIVHTYKQPGTYNVLLIAENKIGCIDTAVQTITVEPPPLQAKDSAITTVSATAPDSIAVLPEQRQNNLLKEIEVTGDSLSVSFYDNAEIDGDSVTIVYNNKLVVTHLFLTDKPTTFMLPVDKTATRNELIMYAENLGSIPPNTALMIVYDGKKRHEISISSSKSSNGMVSFIFKR